VSNFRAIATVTAAIHRLLFETVPVDVTGADVKTVRPDEPGSGGIPADKPVVNVFLYEVRANAAWRNTDLPTRNGNGSLTRRPRAALDLNYLLSFYGDEPAFEPQRLLGSVTRVLHSQPMLTRTLIQQAILDNPSLAGSNLDKQEELVRLTPLSLSLEEMSRLWSVLVQTRYVLSVLYQASPVLIEPVLPVPAALPVRSANLYVQPLRQPTIQRIVAQAGPDQPIFAGASVALLGERLAGEITRVHFAEQEVTPNRVNDARVELTLPAGLRAGVQGARVRHLLPLGTPPVPHRGFDSNVAAFVLHPAISRTVGGYDIVVRNVQSTGTDPRSADVDVKFAPAVSKDQQVTLELLTTETVMMTTLAPERTSDADLITFAVRSVQAGDYLVRVRVDGAESPLDFDTDPASPTFNQPIAPKITIP
jgi:hypothetical protein